MTNQTANVETIEVIIVLEKHNPENSSSGPHWVARDVAGNWRGHCAEHFAGNADAAAAMMFHADEIAASRGDSRFDLIIGEKPEPALTVAAMSNTSDGQARTTTVKKTTSFAADGTARTFTVPESDDPVEAIAKALAVTCDATTLAAVLNSLVGADSEPSLSDAEADHAESLFSELCDLCPEAVQLAQE